MESHVDNTHVQAEVVPEKENFVTPAPAQPGGAPYPAFGLDHVNGIEREPKFNPIFAKLVREPDGTPEQDADRLIGLIAYGLYKEEKRRWYKRFHERYKRSPSSEDKDKFLLSFDQQKLDSTMSQAEMILSEFGDEYCEAQLEDFVEDTIRAQIVSDVNAIKTETLNDVKTLKRATLTEVDEIGLKTVKHINQKIGWVPSIACSILGGIILSVSIVVVMVFLNLALPNSNYSKLAKALLAKQEFQVQIQDSSP